MTQIWVFIAWLVYLVVGVILVRHMRPRQPVRVLGWPIFLCLWLVKALAQLAYNAVTARR